MLRSRYIRTNTDRRRKQSLVNIGVSLKAGDAERPRELERENSTPKRLLAKAELENARADYAVAGANHVVEMIDVETTELRRSWRGVVNP
jgi:hypothetical protein